MNFSEAHFLLDEQAVIILPTPASGSDLRLSRCLIQELSDRYDVQLKRQYASRLPDSGRVILMGSVNNPLVRECCTRERVDVTSRSPGAEGYVLYVGEREVLVAGSDERGAFYGVQSLRQLIRKDKRGVRIRGVRVRDWPSKPFRGVKLYLPGRENVPFFKRFVRDLAALYKFNTMMVEMNACMRLDRHPELNAGWIEFARDTNYSRRNYPPGPLHDREQNSSHQDCCDGSFLEKEEVADLVRWAEENYLEIVPEIPSLTHSFYLLSKHKDLSEVPGDKWPDTYCPSNPGSYKLLFEVMDEYIEVMKPRMIHAGHDEWFAPFGLCPRCKDKAPSELYGIDLRKVHDYLEKRGIKMAIWGDYLLENVRGRGFQSHVAPDGWAYRSPGAMTPEQVRNLVPKDILIFNWFWSEEEKGELNEAQLDEWGFRQVYGNMESEIPNYPGRSKRSTIIGGAPSSWAATTEFNIGKDLIYSILGCSSLLWSDRAVERDELSAVVQASIPVIRQRLRGQAAPSEAGDPVTPVDISPSFNMSLRERTFDVNLEGMQTGRITSGGKVFELAVPEANNTSQFAERKAAVIVGSEGQQPSRLPRAALIKVGEDVTSLIFLHACARPATNKEAYRLIWDFADSADLLGWYEVVYQDGLVENLPIRYGVNILEWNWGRNRNAGKYCYGADRVICTEGRQNPITFFALEWTNPRLGKAIAEVRLKGSMRFQGAVPGFENAFGEVIPTNAVILKGLSIVKPRK